MLGILFGDDPRSKFYQIKLKSKNLTLLEGSHPKPEVSLHEEDVFGV